MSQAIGAFQARCLERMASLRNADAHSSVTNLLYEGLERGDRDLTRQSCRASQ